MENKERLHFFFFIHWFRGTMFLEKNIRLNQNRRIGAPRFYNASNITTVTYFLIFQYLKIHVHHQRILWAQYLLHFLTIGFSIIDYIFNVIPMQNSYKIKLKLKWEKTDEKWSAVQWDSLYKPKHYCTLGKSLVRSTTIHARSQRALKWTFWTW